MMISMCEISGVALNAVHPSIRFLYLHHGDGAGGGDWSVSQHTLGGRRSAVDHRIDIRIIIWIRHLHSVSHLQWIRSVLAASGLRGEHLDEHLEEKPMQRRHLKLILYTQKGLSQVGSTKAGPSGCEATVGTSWTATVTNNTTDTNVTPSVFLHFKFILSILT